MITITVKLISAIDGHTETLAEGIIYNDGTGTHSIGNYKAFFGKKGHELPTVRRNPWKTSEVHGFPRLRKNVWWLLKDALNAVSA